MASAEGELAQATKDLVIAFRQAETAAKKSAKEIAEEARERGTNARAAVAGTLGAVAGAAIGSLGQQGSNSVDAFQAAVQSLTSALPALGATLGSLVGPLGTIAGTAAGGLAAAGIQRETSGVFQARERAISEVSALTASRAAAGQSFDPETLGKLLEVSQVRAYRVINNDAAVRNRATTVFPGAR